MTDKQNPNYVKRRRVLQGLGVAGITSIAGCSGGDTQDTETTTSETDGDETETETERQLPTGKLKFAQAKSPLDFDPIVSNDVPSSQIYSKIFEGLYTYDQGTKTVPDLAAKKAEVSKGGKRWVIPIKEDATFQNGDPVTATDVKYSFEAPVKEETENATEVNMIDSVTVVDEKTVQFDLKYAFGAFNQTLSWAIVPKSVREQDKKAFNKKSPVGSGPYEFVEWQEGNFAKIKRWDDYWGDPLPNISEIRFVPVKEPTTRVTSLETGENDIITDVPPKLWEQVKGSNKSSIAATPGINYFYLAFNCKQGPTADPKVREAIDYTFSMDQAIESFVKPTGTRQYSPLPKPVAKDWNMPLDDWKSITHDKDVDKAKSMLDSSDNVPDDWNAQIIVPPDNKREQIGITVANGLKEAGYKANVQRLDWGAFLDKYVSGDPNDYNMYTLGWSGSPDPDAFTYYFFAEESHGVTDGTFYNEVSEQIVNARESNDRQKRQQLYQEAITQLLEDRVHMPAYNLKNSFGVRSNVKDFRAHPVQGHTLATDYNHVSVE